MGVIIPHLVCLVIIVFMVIIIIIIVITTMATITNTVIIYWTLTTCQIHNIFPLHIFLHIIPVKYILLSTFYRWERQISWNIEVGHLTLNAMHHQPWFTAHSNSTLVREWIIRNNLLILGQIPLIRIPEVHLFNKYFWTVTACLCLHSVCSQG